MFQESVISPNENHLRTKCELFILRWHKILLVTLISTVFCMFAFLEAFVVDLSNCIKIILTPIFNSNYFVQFLNAFLTSWFVLDFWKVCFTLLFVLNSWEDEFLMESVIIRSTPITPLFGFFSFEVRWNPARPNLLVRLLAFCYVFDVVSNPGKSFVTQNAIVDFAVDKLDGGEFASDILTLRVSVD